MFRPVLRPRLVPVVYQFGVLTDETSGVLRRVFMDGWGVVTSIGFLFGNGC